MQTRSIACYALGAGVSVGETARSIATSVFGMALLIGAYVGPIWAIAKLPRLSSRRLRLAGYWGLALIAFACVALDLRAILYWKEAKKALDGKPPEMINAKPLVDKVVRDPIHQSLMTRLVVWEDAWSGSGLAVRYDLRTRRLVGVEESVSDGGLTALAWWLRFVALAAGIRAVVGCASWLRRRRMKREAA